MHAAGSGRALEISTHDNTTTDAGKEEEILKTARQRPELLDWASTATETPTDDMHEWNTKTLRETTTLRPPLAHHEKRNFAPTMEET